MQDAALQDDGSLPKRDTQTHDLAAGQAQSPEKD
jgi:hypothetical protein